MLEFLCLIVSDDIETTASHLLGQKVFRSRLIQKEKGLLTRWNGKNSIFIQVAAQDKPEAGAILVRDSLDLTIVKG